MGTREGKESGINLKFDCVKSFMDTNAFCDFSTKYELDSEIVAYFCESFATHVDLPKEKWFEYHPPIEVKVVEPIKLQKKLLLIMLILLFLPLILRNHLFMLE